MAAEAKNIRQKLPTAVKNASAPEVSAIAGDANCKTELGIEHKTRLKILDLCQV